MSKRLNLREFQQKLIDRLQATDLAARVTTLGVQIAGRNWIVDMMDISEVLPLPAPTAVPFTKPWYRGVSNVRGKLYSVVDMAAYEYSEAASGVANNRVLLVGERFAFNAALLVDRVLGSRDTQAWQQSEVDGQTVYLDEQGAPWRKLDVHSLLGQAEFLQIGV
ncbi:MAG: chemotaxis protein CheW [Gallionella sp.]|jgi:twitching motility protein PilI